MMPKAAHIIFSVLLLGCGARAFLSPKLETARRFHRLHAPQKLLSTLTQDVTDTPVGMELEPEKMNEKFNWFKACYPIVPVEILDAEVPHKFQLLGMDLVVWNDAPVQGGAFGPKKNRPKKAHRSTSGEWRAFVDECPHRKVPLSEGRVEDDGSLLCSYHAWRFDGQGALVDIPQLDKEEEEFHRIQANSKSSCNAFPTQVIDDVLWVWPESGSDARLEAALKEPPLCKTTENVEPDRLFIGKWNFRELPYSADYFIKNVVDPAHVQVSHHNIVGSRYNDQRMKVFFDTALTKDGFAICNETPDGANAATTTYKALSTVPCSATSTTSPGPTDQRGADGTYQTIFH